MLTWFIRRRLAAFERACGYDMSYARDILAADLRAFFAFARIMGLSRYDRGATRDAIFAAKLTAAMAEDCGPCTQLVVSFALRAGSAPSMLADLVAGRVAALPADAALGARFARAVLDHAPAADELREEVVARWGARGLVALGFAITSARLYPTMKYALGHGRACQRVTIADHQVAVARAAEAAA